MSRKKCKHASTSERAHSDPRNGKGEPPDPARGFFSFPKSCLSVVGRMIAFPIFDHQCKSRFTQRHPDDDLYLKQSFHIQIRKHPKKDRSKTQCSFKVAQQKISLAFILTREDAHSEEKV